MAPKHSGPPMISANILTAHHTPFGNFLGTFYTFKWVKINYFGYKRRYLCKKLWFKQNLKSLATHLLTSTCGMFCCTIDRPIMTYNLWIWYNTESRLIWLLLSGKSLFFIIWNKNIEFQDNFDVIISKLFLRLLIDWFCRRT